MGGEMGAMMEQMQKMGMGGMPGAGRGAAGGGGMPDIGAMMQAMGGGGGGAAGGGWCCANFDNVCAVATNAAHALRMLQCGHSAP